jgi:DNA-binding response OmpR family regulator/anti-sigma regulatory factor (Ser/Thr protein kinase)
MKKILVIEDETTVRQNLVELLNAEGFLPIEARDGEEGVHLAWEMLPDLILCDINLPKMDGFGVLSRLSRDPATLIIPFIFLTARTEREDQRRGMSLGADDYIMKPFSIDDVLQAIQKRLEKRALIENQAEKKLAELNNSVRLSLPGDVLTPLSVILGLSELLSDRQELIRLDTSQVCSMSQEIHRGAAMLLRSIQNYKLFSDLEVIQCDANRLRLLRDSRVFSAWMAISEMAALKARQDGREEDIHLQLQDSPLRISEIYLQKIVEELLDNAFKFSPSGSTVVVTGEVQAEHQRYLLKVEDHGRGVLPEQVAMLAGRLQEGTLTIGQAHSGIGLVIVKRLAELHLGSFSMQSQPRQWTVAEVSIPLSD